MMNDYNNSYHKRIGEAEYNKMRVGWPQSEGILILSF